MSALSRASALCALLVLLPVGSASGQGGASADVHVRRPRDFGYFTGDRLELHASVHVPMGFALDERSLRDEGRPDWLEVREATWKVVEVADARLYRFRFVFQVFYAPDSLTRLVVPKRLLVFRSEETEEPLHASIPAFDFTLSPVTDSMSGMEPDWPAPRPSARWIKLLTGSLGVLLGLWAGWVALDRRSRRRRVFWQAHRKVRGARDCAEALLVVHRALEDRAGAALFAPDLDALIDRWPPAGTMRADLQRFFALSEALFYGDHGTDASADCLPWVGQLSQRLMTLERRFGDGQPAAGSR